MRAIFIVTVIIISASFTIAQIASGGQFTVTQSVVATGGNSMQGGQFKVEGTTGQAVAGQKATNQAFGDHAGFWNPEAFAPTAAHVSLTGRVLTADGRGIQKVRITITSPDGVTYSSLSGPFGYFRFDDVEVGMTYVFSVTSKWYQFSQPTIVRNIVDYADDLNFVALPN